MGKDGLKGDYKMWLLHSASDTIIKSFWSREGMRRSSRRRYKYTKETKLARILFAHDHPFFFLISNEIRFLARRNRDNQEFIVTLS